MNRAFTKLISFVAVLIALPAACFGLPAESEVKIIVNLLVNPNVGQFSIPEGHVLPESFWTTEMFLTKTNSNLYFGDKDAPKSAKRVADELRKIADSTDTVDVKKDKIRNLIYPKKDGKFVAEPVEDTPLYKMILADTSDRKGARAWTIFVQIWFVKVSKDSQFLKALGEVIEVAPLLADAMVKVHAAAKGGEARGGTGGVSTAPKYVSPALLRYLRHSNARKARNERRRQIYERLKQ